MIQINNELRDQVYKCACEHKFHEVERSADFWFEMIITELSEVVAADRNGRYGYIDLFKQQMIDGWDEYHSKIFEKYLKDSVGDEFADVIIRCLDFAGLKDIDVDHYDSWLSLDKEKEKGVFCWDIPEFCFPLNRIMTDYSLSEFAKINSLIKMVVEYCKVNDIDIFFHIEQKIKYNELRPRLNGKKY